MDITLIVPTMNRSGFIIRLLRYYHESNFKGRIIIGDSSGLEHALPTRAEIDKLKHALAIEYLAYPGLDTNATFIKLNSMIRTKYIAYLGDDDFLVPSGIEKCIQFLEKNPDYSAAHGNARVFRMQSGAAHGKLKVGVPYYQRGIEYDSPSDRIGIHLADYSVTIFSVHRTDDWQIMWKDLNRVADRAFGAELLPCCLSVILGKIKHLKCLYLLRQSHEQIYHLPTFYDWVTSAEWNSSYKIFKTVLASHLSVKAGISYAEAECVIKNAFRRYLFGSQRTRWERMNEKFWLSVRPTLVKLGEKFPFAKPFGKWLLNSFGKMIRSPRYAINNLMSLLEFIWSCLSTSLSLSFRKDMQDVHSSIKKTKQT